MFLCGCVHTRYLDNKMIKVACHDVLQTGRRKSETSLDSTRPQTLTPGVDRNFSAISRDFEQWYTFIHHPYDEEDNTEQTTSIKGKILTLEIALRL